MNLGLTIRNIRKSKGIRQSDLARHCDTSQGYISQIEQGKREPHATTVQKIADVFDIPVPAMLFLSMEDSDIRDELRREFRPFMRVAKEYIEEVFLRDAK